MPIRGGLVRHLITFLTAVAMSVSVSTTPCIVSAITTDPFTAPAIGDGVTIHVSDAESAPNQPVFADGDTVAVTTRIAANGTKQLRTAFGTLSAYEDEQGGLQSWLWTRTADIGARPLVAGDVVPARTTVVTWGLSQACEAQ